MFSQVVTVNSNNIRVVDRDGEPWFIAADVASTFGLSNMTMALQNINLIDVQNYRVPGTRGRKNKIINESALYTMIMRSDKASARDFQNWVFDTVLLALRTRNVAPTGAPASLRYPPKYTRHYPIV